MGESLPYAPTPPADRVEVIWQGDEFEITIPPRVTRRGLTIMLIAGGLSALLFYVAVLCQRVPMSLRALAGMYGGLAAMVAAVPLGSSRTWGRLTLRNGQLECVAPSLFGSWNKRYALDDTADATVGLYKRQSDLGKQLLLHPMSGKVRRVLDTTVYRAADLEVVAAAIREALRRRRSAAAESTAAPSPGTL